MVSVFLIVGKFRNHMVSFLLHAAGEEQTQINTLTASKTWETAHQISKVPLLFPVTSISSPMGTPICARDYDQKHFDSLRKSFAPPTYIRVGMVLRLVILNTVLHTRFRHRGIHCQTYEEFANFLAENSDILQGTKLKIIVYDGQHRWRCVLDWWETTKLEQYFNVASMCVLAPDTEESRQHLLLLGATENALTATNRAMLFPQFFNLYERLVAEPEEREQPGFNLSAAKERFKAACGTTDSKKAGYVNQFSSVFVIRRKAPELFDKMRKLVHGNFTYRKGGVVVEGEPLKSPYLFNFFIGASFRLLDDFCQALLTGKMGTDNVIDQLKVYHCHNKIRDLLHTFLTIPLNRKTIVASEGAPMFFKKVQDYLDEKLPGQVNQDFFLQWQRQFMGTPKRMASAFKDADSSEKRQSAKASLPPGFMDKVEKFKDFLANGQRLQSLAQSYQSEVCSFPAHFLFFVLVFTLLPFRYPTVGCAEGLQCWIPACTSFSRRLC